MQQANNGITVQKLGPIDKPGIDCRVRLAAIFAASFCAFFLRSEWMLGVAAVVCAVWLLSLGSIKQAAIFSVLYAVLLWVQLSINPNSGFASLLMLANIVRRMMLPAFTAQPLSKMPSGVMLASLGRLKLPRQAIVALAVVFRFMPTVAGEYNAIRTAQKFRGIGITVWGLLLHPARSYETILVPLLIRVTRIADELSASAMLRGAADKGESSSFRKIGIGKKDIVALVLMVLICGALFAVDVAMRWQA